MARNMTKVQNAALLLLRCRLDPKHPLFAGDKQVAKALGDSDAAGLYVKTWVLPLLDYLVNGREVYFGQGDDIKRELSSRQAQADARKRLDEINGGS